MPEEKSWLSRARGCLRSSLMPVSHELNELDWKINLSEDAQRIAQHISAFANYLEGGFFTFGLSPTGEIIGVEREAVHGIIQKLGNVSRDALEPPQKVEYAIDDSFGPSILFVQIPECQQKPVHLRGKGIEFSYIRSGGQTRKMSRQEIANAVLQSRQVRYEELEAVRCEEADMFKLLDVESFLKLLTAQVSGSRESMLEQLINQKAVYRGNGGFSITNLGAIAAAADLSKFPGKERFPLRVIRYRGSSRVETETEREFVRGYGVGFQELVHYIMDQLPTSEIVKDALRKNVAIYPEITIRELVANALVHRDFTITGMNPMVEMFEDRIEILNPGTLLPSVKIERIIDAAPESRNELFAGLMRRMGICEERGSGIDKALFAVELYGLPPIEFVNGPNMFKAVLYSPRKLREMSQEERLRACYQHCCLKYVSGEYMTNASFRARLGLRDMQYPLAWRVIDNAMDRKWIKVRDVNSRSRKYAAYVPFWA